MIENLFDPESKDDIYDADVAIIKERMEKIYEKFETHVLTHRKNLDAKERERIFSADVFSGQRAKELGLVDENGDCLTTMRSKYPDCKIIDFS